MEVEKQEGPAGQEFCFVSHRMGDPQFASAVSENHVPWVRPRYPWEQWKTKSAGTEEDVGCGPRPTTRETTLQPEKPALELNQFLLMLERRDKELNSAERNERILEFVRRKIERLFVYLGDKHPESFKDAVVHLVGSVGEGTKIGVYDEFDFMVELPALKEFKDEKFLQLSGQSKRRVRDQLFQSLHSHWRVFNDPRGNLHSTNTILSLRLPSENVIVFCDIVFYISVEKLNSRKSPICPVCKRNSLRSRVYILPEYGSASEDVQVLKESFVFNENDKLVNSDISMSVRRVYRLTKLLNRDCLFPRFDTERRGFGSAIPSYWLKQVVLFMMDEYPDHEFWQEEYLGLRVAQVFSRLRLCLEKKNLSLYCKPMSFSHAKMQARPDQRNRNAILSQLVEVLKKCMDGEESAVSSLGSFYRANSKFKESKAEELNLASLNSVIVKHTKWLRSPQNSAPTDRSPFLDIMQDVIETYMKAEIAIHEVDGDLLIVYKTETYTLKDFGAKVLRPNRMNMDLKWHKMFEKMLQEDPE